MDRLGLSPGTRAPIGGPRGRFAPAVEGAAAWSPLVLLSALPIVLAVLRQAACLDEGWGGNKPIYRGCYSDILGQAGAGAYQGGVTGYLGGDLSTGQPPLGGLLISLIGGIAPDSNTGRWFVLIWALLGLIALATTAVLVAATLDHPDRVPAMVALSPVVGLMLMLGTEVLPVALSAAAVWAWTNRRSRAAGILFGLAVLAGPWTLLVALAVLLAEGRGPRAGDLRTLGVAAAATVAAVAVLFVRAPSALVAVVTGWWTDGVGNGAALFLFTLAGRPVPAGAASVLAVLGWVAAIVVMVRMQRTALTPPTIGRLAAVGVALVLVTGKSFSLQASVWLTALVALAGASWRWVLIWWAAEAAHYVALWLYVSSYSDASHSLPGPWYAVFLLARLAAVLLLVNHLWPLTVPGGRRPAEPDAADSPDLDVLDPLDARDGGEARDAGEAHEALDANPAR